MTTLDKALEAQKAGDYLTCLNLSRQRLRADPRHLLARQIESLALISLRKHDQAEVRLRKILKDHPNDARSATNLAALCYNTGKDEEAIKWIHKALSITNFQPHKTTQFVLALIQLKNGHWKPGWANYEKRFDVGEAERPPSCKEETQWRGEWLGPSQELAIWSEQGLGDQIQNARFLKEVKQRSGAHVVAVVDPSLVRLFEGLADEVTSAHTLVGAHASICSLPHILGVTPETLDDSPYLPDFIPADKAVRDPGPLRVALTWRGSQENPELRDRSIPHSLLEPLYSIGCDIRHFQYGEDGFFPTDFKATAELLAQCDVVVTIDTSMVHLAGAMGLPTLQMTRYQGDFRWLRDNFSNCWYNSVQIVRQPRLGDWKPVVKDVAETLKEMRCLTQP